MLNQIFRTMFPNRATLPITNFYKSHENTDFGSLAVKDRDAFTQALVKQVAVGKALTKMLRRSFWLGGFTYDEIKSNLEMYSDVSGKIRIVACELCVDMEECDTVFRVYLFNYYLTEDARINNTVRELLDIRLLELGRADKHYDLMVAFTNKTHFSVEFGLKSHIKNTEAVRKELFESITKSIDFMVINYAICPSKDLFSGFLVWVKLKDGSDCKITGMFRIIPRPPYQGLDVLLDCAIKRISHIVSEGNNESDMVAKLFKTFVFSAEVAGPHHSERFFTKAEAEALANQNIVVYDDYNYLDGLYTPSPIGSATWRIKKVDDKFRVERTETRYTTELKNTSQSLAPGAISFYALGRSTMKENMPSNLTRIESLGFNHKSKTEIYSIDTLLRESRKRNFSTHAIRRYKPKSKLLKSKIASIDFETVTIDNQIVPYLLGIFHDGKYISFQTPYPRDPAEVDWICSCSVKYILDNLQGYKIFAHNLIKFDLVLILKYLVQEVFERFEKVECNPFRFVETEDRLISIHILGYNISFVDSLKFFPMKLNDVAKAFISQEKLKLDDQIHLIEPKDLYHKMESLIECNRRDCEILVNCLRVFEGSITSKFKIEPFKSTTLPSLAYRIWRMSSVLEESKIYVPPAEFEPTIRAAYRSGRCEVIHHFSSGNIHYIDFNSLYPAVAIGFPYPTGFLDRVKFKYKDKVPMGIYYCKVVAKTTYIPFLPTRYQDTTIYPVGTWFACYTSVEINYARSLGTYEITIIDGHTYKNEEYIFDEYINTMFEWKQKSEDEGNQGQRTMAKLLMNSLLGKFGQKSSNIQTRILPPAQASKLNTFIGIEGRLSQKKLSDEYSLVTLANPGKTSESTPQISAFVTAYGRIMLHKSMMKISNEGGKILYTDTDAIMFEHPNFDLNEFNRWVVTLYDKLPNKPLGQFANVYKESKIKDVTIIASKCYRLGFEDGKSIAKLAGFPVNEAGVSKELWSKLAELRHRDLDPDAKTSIPVKESIRIEREQFSLSVHPGYEKSIVEGARSEAKRKRIFDGKEYIGTEPVSIFMKDEVGAVYKNKLMSGEPPRNEFFSFHSGLEV